MKYGKERRAILQNQPQDHLDKIVAALKNHRPERKSYFNQFSNYQKLLDDIKIEKLSRPYNSLEKNKNPDVRQLFVLDLLRCNKDEMQIILKKHTLADLIILFSSLTTDTKDRAQFYKQKANFPVLYDELRKEILFRPSCLLTDPVDKAIVVKNLEDEKQNQQIQTLNSQSINDLESLHFYLLNEKKDSVSLINLVTKQIDKLLIRE